MQHRTPRPHSPTSSTTPATVASTATRPSRRHLVLAVPILAVLAVPTVGCESDSDPSTSSIVGPADVSGDDSTTSSLADSSFTAPPNPNAGGDGAPASAP